MIVNIVSLLSVARFELTTCNVILELAKDRLVPESGSPSLFLAHSFSHPSYHTRKVLVALLSFNAISERLLPARDSNSIAGTPATNLGSLPSSSGSSININRLTTLRNVVMHRGGQPTLRRQTVQRFHADANNSIMKEFAKSRLTPLISMFCPGSGFFLLSYCIRLTDISAALDRIIADCNAQFGSLLLTDPKCTNKSINGA